METDLMILTRPAAPPPPLRSSGPDPATSWWSEEHPGPLQAQQLQGRGLSVVEGVLRGTDTRL